MGNLVSGLLVVGMFLGICAGILYWVAQKEKRWKQLTRELALQLGGPADPTVVKTWTEDTEVYQWKSDGLTVTLGGGSEAVHAGAQMTAVTKGSFHASYPAPLAVELSITRGGGSLTGDAGFDKVCAVSTTNEPAARKLLDDPGLRDAIRTMADSWVRLVTINQDGVHVQFFQIEEFKSGTREALSLASRVVRRARQTGLLPES